MLWATLVSGVGMLGIADAVTFRSAREGAGPSAALSNAVLLAIVQSLALGGIGWVVVNIVLRDKPVLPDAQFYLWFIPLNLLTLYPSALLQGRMSMWSFNAIRGSVHIFYTAGLTLLWATHHVDVRSALSASLTANVVALAFCVAATLRGRLLSLDLA
jgi:hypothetical protein